MTLVGMLIAIGLGVWAYGDAKKLASQGIRVGSFSPAGWGWAVALLAIVFGIMYLVQRPKAIAAMHQPQPYLFPPPHTPATGSPRADAIASTSVPGPPVAPPVAAIAPRPSSGNSLPLGDEFGTHRYCEDCGTQMRAHANFCPGCGRQQ